MPRLGFHLLSLEPGVVGTGPIPPPPDIPITPSSVTWENWGVQMWQNAGQSLIGTNYGRWEQVQPSFIP